MPKPCDCVVKSVPCSVCCVMVGMCLAVVSWQSKNGLLVTLPPSQPVAGLRLHHLQLLPAVARALAMQGKPALNRCTTRMPRR